ncbi:MAG: Hsp70 family protein [Ruminiclostridium sp.]|nr:Hsp70 family protein [Ruminiclostridium sp.]
METRSFFGIDFGTTNTSVVQIIKEEGLGEKETIYGEDGSESFASMLAIIDEKTINFGNEVKSNRDSLAEKCTVISSFKSLLGTGTEINIQGKVLYPKDVTALYLKCLKQYIKQTFDIDIKKASFSFPVGFSPEARRDLKFAAQKAGIEVSALISESTAAYIAEHKNMTGFSRVMVVDWGGGTLDISILEIEHRCVFEKSVYGEKIGGDDIDKELAKAIHSQFGLKISDPTNRVNFDEMPAIQRDKIISACERAKISISEDGETYPLTVRDYGAYGTKTINITNEFFEDIVKPIIKQKVLRTINSAMERAGVTKSGIDCVIIAGGSSNLRPFADAMKNLFGEDKIFIPNQVRSVSAKGAACTPIIGGQFKLSDNIGIMMSDNTVFPILKRDVDGVNTISEKYTFSLVEDSPDAHIIITDGAGKTVYKKINVPTKGFLRERLEIQAHIDDAQIATINIRSTCVSDVLKESKAEISQLTFYYDLKRLDA